MADFAMPSLGADMEDGELVEWLKQPGDAIARGDIVAVVETQKGAIEIEAYENGVLESILVQPGTRVPVGTPLARIAGESNGGPAADAGREPAIAMTPALDASAPAGPAAAAAVAVTGGSAASDRRRSSTTATDRRLVSPFARRLAAGAGIDLAALDGHGPGGAVLAADVEAAIATAAAPDARVGPRDEGRRATTLPTGMRDAIAAAMSRSKREIPHYYLAHSIDLDATTRWLEQENEHRPPADRVLLGALLIGAVARAARVHPAFNGHYIDGRFHASESVHVGTAIRLRGGGLVAPAVHDADRLAADELMARLRDLIERVRDGRFRASELTDPTLTVSSVGEHGVATLFGVIHPPQVCLVGFGAPQQEVGVRDGEPAVQRRLSITLAADHRVSDGHAGSRFLLSIAKSLTSPASWACDARAPTHPEPHPRQETRA